MPVTTTNGMSIDVALTGMPPNGPDLVKKLGDQVDAFYGPSEANAAGLPAVGDFLGQRIWLTDVKGWAVWNGSAWSTDTGLILVGDAGGPAFGSGWANATYTSGFRRRGGMVTVFTWAAKTSWALDDLMFTLPAGFRPAEVLSYNCVWDTGRNFRIEADGEVRAHAAGTGGANGTITFPAAY